jgi:hypothetical protein
MRLSTILNSLLLLAAGTLAAPVNEPRNDAVAENRGCGTAQTYDKIAVGLMAKDGNCQELAQVPQEFHVGNGCACDFYTYAFPSATYFDNVISLTCLQRLSLRD